MGCAGCGRGSSREVSNRSGFMRPRGSLETVHATGSTRTEIETKDAVIDNLHHGRYVYQVGDILQAYFPR